MKFPILECENEIQVNDKIRFNARKSFFAKDETETLGVMKICLFNAGECIDIYDEDIEERYLDWMYLNSDIDVVDFNKIYFSDLTATVATGTYSMSTLVTAIATAMKAVDPTNTFTVTADSENRITIETANAIVIQGQKNTTTNNLLPHIGFKTTSASSKSLTGDRIEYGLKRVSLEVGYQPEIGDAVISSLNKTIKVYSEWGDRLFASDADLLNYESDILNWLPDHRASYLHIHRKSQRLILDWLNQKGYTHDDGTPLDKWSFIDLSELREWSTFLALRLIFQEIQNAKDDVFKEKSKMYEKLELGARDKFILRFDTNKDGVQDVDEGLSITFGEIIRR